MYSNSTCVWIHLTCQKRSSSHAFNIGPCFGIPVIFPSVPACHVMKCHLSWMCRFVSNPVWFPSHHYTWRKKLMTSSLKCFSTHLLLTFSTLTVKFWFLYCFVVSSLVFCEWSVISVKYQLVPLSKWHINCSGQCSRFPFYFPALYHLKITFLSFLPWNHYKCLNSCGKSPLPFCHLGTFNLIL